ncbi:hypothetical protein ABIE45_003836 [Methylobacterium sp. OAE515]|uniref:hypothetical protein n=1 Tax=Methylobacterium sp. OAE515 TaxID=2817895 RepID=UPI001789D055
MSRPAAFFGELADIRFQRADRTLRAEIALPIQAFDAFRARIGFPPAAASHGAPEAAPAVALLPCRRLRHPDQEADALADAALTLLEELIASGDLRFDVRRARRVEALANAVPFQPLHVVEER